MADEEKKEKCPAGAPAWMCTFADLMSLLLCFFVLLLSFSELNRQKFKQVAGAMEEAFGVQRIEFASDNPEGMQMISPSFPTVPLDVKVQIMEAITEEMDKGMVDALESGDGVKLRVKDAVAFDEGKAMLREEFKPFLDKIGKLVAEAGLSVAVSGHTDNLPLKRDADYATNWGLSTARAVQVVEYWTARYGIPADKLAAIGLADGQPLAANDTAEGRARNRRVEIFIRTLKNAPAFQGIKEILDTGQQ